MKRRLTVIVLSAVMLTGMLGGTITYAATDDLEEGTYIWLDGEKIPIDDERIQNVAIVLTPDESSELKAAPGRLVELGIYEGDESGNLNLDKGLTRVELAVLTTRLNIAVGDAEALAEWESQYAKRTQYLNPFRDIPEWARPYVEYVYDIGYMNGTGDTTFDPQASVSPQMACALILRICNIPQSEWEYTNAIEKAQSLGLGTRYSLDGSEIYRGTMAVIVCRGIDYQARRTASAAEVTPAPAPSNAPMTWEEQQAYMLTDEYADAVRAEFYRLLNEHRVNNGLRELEVNLELQEYADVRADEQRTMFGHIRPDGTPAGSGWYEMYNIINSRYAENAIPTSRLHPDPHNTALGIFSIWKDSDGHNRHMLYDFYPEITMAFGIAPKIDEDGMISSGAIFASGY